jgi:hypothetical protein
VHLNLPDRSVRLHDAMRAYFARNLLEPARLHAKLADTWKEPGRITRGYAVQHVAYHVTASMSDPGQVLERGRQLVDLLTDPRYREYQYQHGDHAAIDRHIISALKRAAESAAPEAPALVVLLSVLRKSYSATGRDPALIFKAAAEGKIAEAVERLTLFEADEHWDTLGRLLIAWLAPLDRAAEARALTEEVVRSCDRPELRSVLAWVRQPPDGVPAGLPPISGPPALSKVSAILQRCGGAEAIEGLEPLDFENLASGTDASGFIAERDGPELVAFAKADPASNTQYLVRYIEIHAANRYIYYRNRSLWALLKPVLQFPEAAWVRVIVQRIVTAALTVTSIEFEEFLPLVVRGLQARAGDQAAAAVLEDAKRGLFADATRLQPDAGETDSWPHYQRRACALAEIYAVALERPAEAADLLGLAGDLPKGFARFRAFAALMRAESTQIAAPGDRNGIDIALESARAASHRVQDHLLCLQATAMEHAIRSRWWKAEGMDVETQVECLLADPLAEDFCIVHRVLEDFEYRTREHQSQALPIPYDVQHACTLAQVAKAYERKPEQLLPVNGWIWANRCEELHQVLAKDDEVNIPDPDFVPILAARFAAQALALPALLDECRCVLIQRLASLTLAHKTVLDTVLVRLLLAARAHGSDAEVAHRPRCARGRAAGQSCGRHGHIGLW